MMNQDWYNLKLSTQSRMEQFQRDAEAHRLANRAARSHSNFLAVLSLRFLPLGKQQVDNAVKQHTRLA